MKRNTITRRLGLYTLLGFLACSRDHGDRPGVARTAAATVSDEKPAPFDAGPVKIALVQNSGAGDYFEQWTVGSGSRPPRPDSRFRSTTPRPTLASRPTP